MIRTFTLSLALAASASLLAQINGNGYYRLQNYGTTRYAYITDDKGSIDLGTTSADLYAIQLWKKFDLAASDPASVIYLKNAEGRQYDIQGQGAELYKMLGHYLSVYENKDNTYYAYATNSGVTKYLYDGDNGDIAIRNDNGWLSTNGTGIDTKYRKWYVTPITTDDSNYFGIKPDLSVGTSYYTTFYASFPFSFASSGMEAWYVSAIDTKLGVAIIEPVQASSVIAPATPLIVRCSSSAPINNKLNIGGTASADVSSKNLLKGVYFNNLTMKTHYNYVSYDAQQMRVLGLTSNGSLGFVTSSTLATLPANKAYLPVTAATPSELKLVTQEEYAKLIVSSASAIKANSQQGPFDVYNILGVKVRSQVTSLQGIPAGIYLVNGRKICIR